MYKVPLFFWFDLFLEARAEILEKILVQTITPKGHFEITWPLNPNSCQYPLIYYLKPGTITLDELASNGSYIPRPEYSRNGKWNLYKSRSPPIFSDPNFLQISIWTKKKYINFQTIQTQSLNNYFYITKPARFVLVCNIWNIVIDKIFFNQKYINFQT